MIVAPEHGATRAWGLMKNVSLPQEVLEISDYFMAHDYYTYRHFLVVNTLIHPFRNHRPSTPHVAVFIPLTHKIDCLIFWP